MEVPRADEIPFQDFEMMDEVDLWRSDLKTLGMQ
jgi:myb proto-oncogene protein